MQQDAQGGEGGWQRRRRFASFRLRQTHLNNKLIELEARAKEQKILWGVKGLNLINCGFVGTEKESGRMVGGKKALHFAAVVTRLLSQFVSTQAVTRFAEGRSAAARPMPHIYTKSYLLLLII